MAPAGAGLVVFHGAEDVVVDGASFLLRSGGGLGLFSGELSGNAGDRDEAVGLEKSCELKARRALGMQAGRRFSIDQHNVLAADDVIVHGKLVFGFVGLGDLGIENFVGVVGLADLPERQVADSGGDVHVLECVGVGEGNPDAETFAGRHVLDGEGVVEGEAAFLLGDGGECQQNEQQDKETAGWHDGILSGGQMRVGNRKRPTDVLGGS